MSKKKVIGIVVAAVAIYFLVTEPTEAAAFVQWILLGLKSALEAIVTFLKSVFNG